MLQSLLLLAQKKRWVSAHAFIQDTKLKNSFFARKEKEQELDNELGVDRKRAHDVAISLSGCVGAHGVSTCQFNCQVRRATSSFILLPLRNHCAPSVAETCRNQKGTIWTHAQTHIQAHLRVLTHMPSRLRSMVSRLLGNWLPHPYVSLSAEWHPGLSEAHIYDIFIY